MIFTTGIKELATNALHARIPLSYVLRNVWLNLSIDMASFCSACFKGSTYRATEVITLCSHCRVRRVFTMRSPILDVNDERDSTPTAQVEMLPKAVEFPPGVNFSNQVLAADKIGVDNSAEDTLAVCPAQMLVEGTRVPKTVQLAFGTRMAGRDPRHQAQGSIDELHAHGNGPNRSTIKDSPKDAVVKNQQHLAAGGRKGPSPGQAKRSSRKSRAKDPARQRASDPKVTYNTLQFKYPHHEESKVVSSTQDRDVSEPPRQSSLRRPGHSGKPRQKSKDSPRHSRSPNRGGALDGKLRPPATGKVELHNQRVTAAGVDGWVGEKSMCASGSAAGGLGVSSGASAAVTGSTGTDKVAAAAVEKRAGRGSENTKKGRLAGKKQIQSAKKRIDPPQRPSLTKKTGKKLFGEKPPCDNVRIDSKQKNKKDEPADGKREVIPNAVLLEESLGGTQLNSFKIPDMDQLDDNGSEIEEIIEGDEKLSHKDSSVQDSLAGPSPL